VNFVSRPFLDAHRVSQFRFGASRRLLNPPFESRPLPPLSLMFHEFPFLFRSSLIFELFSEDLPLILPNSSRFRSFSLSELPYLEEKFPEVQILPFLLLFNADVLSPHRPMHSESTVPVFQLAPCLVP